MSVRGLKPQRSPSSQSMYTENELSQFVLDSALKVHRNLGPGLLESAYEVCLLYELSKQGLNVVRQHPVRFIYDGVDMAVGYRADLLIDHQVLVEIKSVDALHDVHLAQVLTYLKILDIRLGLLINFNVKLLKNGFRRVVNNL